MNQDIENIIKKCKRSSLPQSEWKGRLEKPLCKVGETTYEQHILEETESKSIKEQLEEVIKKNLPEKKEENPFTKSLQEEITLNNNRIFNQALSQINPSLIADEVLKVVVEKIMEVKYSSHNPIIDCICETCFICNKLLDNFKK